MPIADPWRGWERGWIVNSNTSTTGTGHYTWTGTTTTPGWNDWQNPYTITWTTGTSTLNLWQGEWIDVGYTTEDINQVVTQIEAVAEDEARRNPFRRGPRVEPSTPEARAALQAQRQQTRAAAIARGEELLLSLLDEAQIASYRLDGHFEVIGSHGTLYRVHRGTSGNIEWVKPDGSVGGRLCAHPTMEREWIPTEDVMLAQLLALQHNEREFVRVANVHAGTRPPMREVARARWEQSVVVG